MNHPAPGLDGGTRPLPNGGGDSDPSVALAANDVVARVAAEHPSSEVVAPNPSDLSVPPPVTNTASEVATLKAEVGRLTEMFEAFMAQSISRAPLHLQEVPSHQRVAPQQCESAETSPSSITVEVSNSPSGISLETTNSCGAPPSGESAAGSVSPVQAPVLPEGVGGPAEESLSLVAPGNSKASETPDYDSGSMPHQHGTEEDRTSGIIDGKPLSAQNASHQGVRSQHSGADPDGSIGSNDSARTNNARSRQIRDSEQGGSLEEVANSSVNTHAESAENITTGSGVFRVGEQVLGIGSE